MATVIKVENLSKRYTIRHQRERYHSLRDTLVGGSRSAIKRVFSKKENINEKPVVEDFFALQDVSFSVEQGDRVGIIGRNGAGKSTLLKLLSRITEPSRGKISLSGRVVSLLEVGTGFHPELTGRENVFLNGAILGMSRIEIKAKFDEIVAFAEVENFLDTPVKRYSSGMYVRLAFAVAAHLDPEILLIDEVLAVGDAQFQKKCLGKMGEVGKEGRTLLFVSHNMSAINTLCNRSILLRNGEILVNDTTDKAVSTYLSQNANEAEISFPLKPELPAQIMKTTILDSHYVKTKQIHFQEGFYISVSIAIREKYQFYNATMTLRDSFGNVIVFANDRELADTKLSEISGNCEYRIRMPERLLRPGFYYVRVMFFKRQGPKTAEGILLSDNEKFPLSFEIVDLESRRAREGLYRDAAVAPELPWELVCLS